MIDNIAKAGLTERNQDVSETAVRDAEPGLSTEDLEAAERRREALRLVLEKASMTPADAAREAQLRSPNSLYNFLNRRSHSLSAKTLEALARVVPGATIATLGGIEGESEPVEAGGSSVIVQMEARAGVWRPSGTLPLAEQFEVPIPLKPGMRSSGAFGAVVKQPGANLAFPEGTILVCMPLERCDFPLDRGAFVLLERTREKKVEVTVRELRPAGDSAWLWLRCDDPRFQVPAEVSWPLQNRSWMEGDIRLRVAGVVCGSYRPEC